MSNNFKKTIASFLPYIYLVIGIVIVSILFFLFLYVGLIGAIIGGMIYFFIYIKNKFFGTKNINSTFSTRNNKFENINFRKDESAHKGRTFDNEE